MRIEVFNVGHGQCAVITAPNGRRMMLDCGDRWGDDRFWTPSLHFFRQTIDLLGLMNLDEDHLSDFKDVMQDCTVPWILSNPTVGSREFALLKKDSMGPGSQAVAAWLAQPKSSLAGLQPDFGDVQIRWYYPFFISGAANKTNDLSLAVIVQFGTFKILFAGDLEVGGWRRLLTIPAFRQDVQGVSVFVASHHGRESGCCTELFEWLRPQLVIISDSERQYRQPGYRRLVSDPLQRRGIRHERAPLRGYDPQRRLHAHRCHGGRALDDSARHGSRLATLDHAFAAAIGPWRARGAQLGAESARPQPHRSAFALAAGAAAETALRPAEDG
jgi:beta-lactamase superfamily II metal-dependent hydrolase